MYKTLFENYYFADTKVDLKGVLLLQRNKHWYHKGQIRWVSQEAKG